MDLIPLKLTVQINCPILIPTADVDVMKGYQGLNEILIILPTLHPGIQQSCEQESYCMKPVSAFITCTC